MADELQLYFRRVAAKTLGHRLRHKLDPSDVVQQALLTAFARRAQFHGGNIRQWRGWLLAIVRNQARKTRRYWNRERRDIRREQPLLDSSGHGYPLAADGSTPSGQQFRRDEAERVLAALHRLSPDYQQVLRLRTFEDRSLAEVAQCMDRSVEAVRKLWTRAIQALRHELGENP
jgi:RNA polymerase sigma-70 factor (ECF subfamily)